METKIFDPKKIGPGVWYTLHILAEHSDANETPLLFINVLKIIVKTLKCKICRLHATSYIEKNNPYDSIVSESRGCYFYINRFHNTVNLRLKKPIYSLTKSKEIYNEECDECGHLPYSQKKSEGNNQKEVTFL